MVGKAVQGWASTVYTLQENIVGISSRTCMMAVISTVPRKLAVILHDPALIWLRTTFPRRSSSLMAKVRDDHLDSNFMRSWLTINADSMKPRKPNPPAYWPTVLSVPWLLLFVAFTLALITSLELATRSLPMNPRQHLFIDFAGSDPKHNQRRDTQTSSINDLNSTTTSTCVTYATVTEKPIACRRGTGNFVPLAMTVSTTSDGITKSGPRMSAFVPLDLTAEQDSWAPPSAYITTAITVATSSTLLPSGGGGNSGEYLPSAYDVDIAKTFSAAVDKSVVVVIEAENGPQESTASAKWILLSTRSAGPANANVVTAVLARIKTALTTYTSNCAYHWNKNLEFAINYLNSTYDYLVSHHGHVDIRFEHSFGNGHCTP
jgi:hypothetical protein